MTNKFWTDNNPSFYKGAVLDLSYCLSVLGTRRQLVLSVFTELCSLARNTLGMKTLEDYHSADAFVASDFNDQRIVYMAPVYDLVDALYEDQLALNGENKMEATLIAPFSA